jgi:putative SOS response-associated peptidase YedK
LHPPTAPPALPSLPSVRIGEHAPAIAQRGNIANTRPMRFGLPPARTGAGPLFNMRSDDRHFEKSNRCIIPASAFFEFTGSSYPKTKHRFTATDGFMMGIAGIWRDIEGEQRFTMLTTEPGPDIAPIHNRQVVVLERGHWAAWLYLSEPEEVLLRLSPQGSLLSEIMRRGA